MRRPLGKVQSELRPLGIASKLGGGQHSGDAFVVTARWGSAGKASVTMPGNGKTVQRAFSADESGALGATGVRLLGPDTLDVFLNDSAHWRNVPRRVWDYTLGGYQVLKKWLSYREQAILGRALTVDEVAYITQVIRRIAALILLGPDLDANYLRIKENTYEWPK
jgi:Type ISP C-terminal specificity domain